MKFSHFNWPVWLGGVLSAFIVILAWWGPDLAPQDPLKENFVIQVGDKFVAAPFAPFVVPGYPLGSDAQGRDVLSLLLWAVRPTLLLVCAVATVRLLLGLGLGLVAGWGEGRGGRLLDGLISAALAAPVLIVALAVIALIGLDAGRGLWAFGLGLALTGWAETARVVSEETRRVKVQNYVEAARALGAHDGHLLRWHIFPHVLPLVWALAAFEISHTLLTLASLGFLGYYTNDVWIMITDTTAQRFSGKPDLGQMLASVTTDIITGPWKMFAAGSLIFLMVLAFNLLGEGLRQWLMVEHGGSTQPAWFKAWTTRLEAWRETPTGTRAFNASRWALPLVIGLLLLAWFLPGWLTPAAVPVTYTMQPVPGNHLWATERHDAAGSLWTNARGPETPPQLLWTVKTGGLTGGPAVAADGTLYLGALDPAAYAFDPAGQLLWTTSLPAPPVGSPALDAAGNIYFALQNGQLVALDPQGHERWIFTPATEVFEVTGGPVVNTTGEIYYTMSSDVQAVSAAGEALWRANAFARRVSAPPRLAWGADWLVLMNQPLSTTTGQPLNFALPLRPDQFSFGADGKNYLRLEHTLSHWQRTGPEAGAVMQTFTWDVGGSAVGLPTDTGVTLDGVLWLSYATGFQDARFVWLNRTGDIINVARFAHRPSRVLGVDAANTAYLCGTRRGGGSECLALQPGRANPTWVAALPPGSGLPVGGAIVPGRLYVALENGKLVALGAAP